MWASLSCTALKRPTCPLASAISISELFELSSPRIPAAVYVHTRYRRRRASRTLYIKGVRVWLERRKQKYVPVFEELFLCSRATLLSLSSAKACAITMRTSTGPPHHVPTARVECARVLKCWHIAGSWVGCAVGTTTRRLRFVMPGGDGSCDQVEGQSHAVRRWTAVVWCTDIEHIIGAWCRSICLDASAHFRRVPLATPRCTTPAWGGPTATRRCGGQRKQGKSTANWGNGNWPPHLQATHNGQRKRERVTSSAITSTSTP